MPSSIAVPMAASAATPIALWLMGRSQPAELFAALAVMLWFRHKVNIERLMAGTESKIGRKETPEA